MTAGGAGLRVSLELQLPDPLRVGAGNAFLVVGSCSHPTERLRRLDVELDATRTPVLAFGLPGRDGHDRRGGRRAKRGGFCAIVPAPGGFDAAAVELSIVAQLGAGREMRAPLGKISLDYDRPSTPPAGSTDPGADFIAICMATHEPPRDLFRRQVESIRAQTHGNWVCVISDDASSENARTMIRELVGGDERFQLFENERRLGVYHNFERALHLAPTDAPYVALADQDDHWYPEKLETLLGAIGAANLAYSDARIVDAEGRVLSRTYWSERRNQWTDLTSLVLANTVTGAAALYRRAAVESALPFPPASGRGFFHDHWIAIMALATGAIRYVDRPLYDYVQHPGAALGHERATRWARGHRSRREKLRLAIRDPGFFAEHWRETYFSERCRAALFARAALLRDGRGSGLERLAGPDSASLVAWLARRRVKRLIMRDDTLGAEGRLLRALAWRLGAGRVA